MPLFFVIFFNCTEAKLELSQKELFLISYVLYTTLVSESILFVPSYLPLGLDYRNNNLVIEQVEAMFYFGMTLKSDSWMTIGNSDFCLLLACFSLVC